MKQIHERLNLFPCYLEYRINNWQLTTWGKVHTYNTLGLLFYSNLVTFDEWLIAYGREDLV